MEGTFTLANIGQLVTNDPALGDGPLGLLRDAAITVVDGMVHWVGPTAECGHDAPVVDADGRAALPGFVDCHSHLVFAGDRSAEFAARMAGVPYSAGGIAVTVAATRAASEDTLRRTMRSLMAEMHAGGTTTIEIKSGYGLDTPTEQRSVLLAAEVTPEVTYLGAHVVAPEFHADPDGYVNLVCGDMLQACAPHSRWIDVFCDRGAFTTEQTRRILTAGIAAGLRPRVHLAQLEPSDAIAMAIDLDCASADHLTYLSDADIDLLAHSDTVAALVPAADFSTRSPQYPRARDLLDAGATVALSPDCNPGSSYTTSMAFTIALAVRDLRMTVDEAVAAATIGGAAALRRSDIGRLTPGTRADIALLRAPSHIHLAYRPGVPLVTTTWRAGRIVYTEGELQ